MIRGLKFTIFGTPRTKKNHGRRIKRGRRIFNVASEAHENWVEIARKSLRLIRQQIADAGITLPITADVNCAALYFRHADVGDAVGFHEAVADWLQKVGILKNDVQIRQWDGSRLRQDPKLPRIEITLDQLEPREKTPRAMRRMAPKKGAMKA